MPNFIDRYYEFVSPEKALARSTARQKLQQTTALTQKQRGYDAATGGRMDSMHGGRRGPVAAFNLSQDMETWGKLKTLRERSRELARNNPHYLAAINALVSNLVGSGIFPRPVSGNEALDKQVKELFAEWSASCECDADGQSDFAGFIRLAVRMMIESGEVLVRRRIDKRRTIPLKCQLLEADYLDDFRNGPLGEVNSMTIMGVEVSQDPATEGDRLNYWLFPQHPGQMMLGVMPSISGIVSAPVPASEVLHCYEKTRTQSRGIPFGVSVMMRCQSLDDYEEAELERKKIESSNVAFVTTTDDESYGINPEYEDVTPGCYNSYGDPVERFQPGAINYLYGGKDIKFNTPASIGGYNEYKVSQLRSIAAGFRIPYELVSGDVSQVNFTSIRAGLVEFRRFVQSTQRMVLVPMLLQPIWDWFIEAAYLAGKIDVDHVPVKWSFPKFEYVNPADDVAADLMAIRAGLKSYHDVIAEYGYDPDEVLGDALKFQTFCTTTGLVLDTNPADVSMKGVTQKNEPGKAPKAPDKLDHDEEARGICLQMARKLLDEAPSEGRDQLIREAFALAMRS